jgi:regulator of G-protein signaling
LDLDETSSGLSGNEVFIEQRVIFKLDLPNRKIISVKSKPSKLVFEVLKPILHKYNYRLDMVEAFGKDNEPIDTALQVTSVDGMRLQIVCKDETNNNNNNNVEDSALSHRNFSAPVTFVRANKLVSSISNPQLNTLALDEITNKVFNEVLQGKGEVGSGSGVNGVVHGTNRNSGGDHISVKVSKISIFSENNKLQFNFF